MLLILLLLIVEKWTRLIRQGGERSSLKVMEEESRGSDQHKDHPPRLNDAAGDAGNATVRDKKARCHITQVLVSSFYRFGFVLILIYAAQIYSFASS